MQLALRTGGSISQGRGRQAPEAPKFPSGKLERDSYGGRLYGVSNWHSYHLEKWLLNVLKCLVCSLLAFPIVINMITDTAGLADESLRNRVNRCCSSISYPRAVRKTPGHQRLCFS